ncbi:ribonuclease H1 small subunit [Byssothecium circinans]|uniref:Ribonuclease H1 small subunit n=1 Tax=Byssothecium circinans TaxID=147558 RepID=A0A6A5TFE3_9PLEO|nr:ribonuclease H1 small subunit [Byssothecium circinans]KAF1950864.1 ribonuclease H1 small subunit [Byssothecium circinans]
MLSIQPPTSKPQKSTPNLLPARINHNGPINSTERFFRPTKDDKGTSHVYLRGRHLHGTTVALPSTHTGAVVHITDNLLPQSQTQSHIHPQDQADGEEREDEDEDLREEVKVVEVLGEFDEVVVWGHAETVDEEKDAFVRGMREWVGFAEAMHGQEEEGEKGEGVKEG